MVTRPVQFVPGGVKENSVLLCTRFNYESESDVHIKKITVLCDGKKTSFPVGPGKYKSALWVIYWPTQLVGIERTTADRSHSFTMTEAAKESARQYFGEEIVNDAINNEDTLHKFVRAILCGKNVTVSFS